MKRPAFSVLWAGMPWRLVFAGTMMVWIALAHVPARVDALNYFDPPKRLLWPVLALVLTLFGSLRENRLGRIAGRLLAGLMAWMLLRTLARPIPDAELEVVFIWCLPLVMLVAGASLPHHRGRHLLGWFLLATGGIQAVLMLLQRVGWDPLFAATTASMAYAPGRMIGTIGYHNQAVDCLALSGAGVLLLFQSPLARIVALLPMMAVATATGNRGGILAFAGAVFVSQWLAIGWHGNWNRSARWRAIALSVGILLAGLSAVMLAPLPRARFLEAARGLQGSAAARSRMYMGRIGLDLFRERPWTGWGAGEYALQYLDRLGSTLPADKSHDLLQSLVYAREAHNDGIQFAAEFGLVGLLLLSGIVGIGVWRWVSCRHDDPDAPVMAAYVLVFMTLSSLFSFPWQTSMAGPLAGLLLGWAWPAESHGQNAAKPSFPSGFSRLAAKTSLLAAILVMLAWFGWDAWLNRIIPQRLAAGQVEAARQALPPFGYRYRALVGATYAAGQSYAAAERELYAAELGTRDILLWSNLAHVRASRSKWNDAVQLYERWARCGLDYSNALVNLSVAYEKTGQWEKARRTLSQKCFLFPEASLEELRRLAVLYLLADNPKAACNLLESRQDKWERADTQARAEFQNLIGASYMAMGDRPTASHWFQNAIATDPTLESARRNLSALPSFPMP